MMNPLYTPTRQYQSAWRALRRWAGGLAMLLLASGALPALKAQVPAFTVQPLSQGVLINTAVTLTVTVSGAPAPALQWYRGGVPLAGKTTATLSIPTVTLADAGTYYVIATNSLGSTRSSDAVLTVLRGLERFGPLMSLQSTSTNPRPSYPEWYQDTTGLTLELLTPKSAAELQAGYDVILPTDTTFDAALGAEPFPTGWFLEHFYWFARSEFLINGSRARLGLALEASFGNAASVVAGDEVVFTRIRFDLPSAPFAGDYLIQTPYSQHEVKGVAAGGKIRTVEDVGIAPPPAGFALSLRSKVGPFLTAADAAGNELPLHTGVDGLQYLADPLRIGPVTGSPFGPARNSIRIFYKAATATTYPATPNWSSTDFVLYGRVKTTPIPTRTSLDRVTKTTNGTDRRLDIYASADASLPVRLPPAAASVKRTPVLSFILPGTTTKVAMVSAASSTTPTTYFWYQHPFANLAASNAVPLGSQVSIVDDSSPTAPATFTAKVNDMLLFNTSANPVVLYTPAAKTLALKFYSSTGAVTATALPSVMSPNLIPYAGATYNATTGILTVPNVVAPPSEVLVVSPGGGADVLLTNSAVK